MSATASAHPMHRRRGDDCSRLHESSRCERRASSDAGSPDGPSRNSCARPSSPGKGCTPTASLRRRPALGILVAPLEQRSGRDGSLQETTARSWCPRGAVARDRVRPSGLGDAGGEWFTGANRRYSPQATRAQVALDGSRPGRPRFSASRGKPWQDTATALSQDDAGYLGPTFRVRPGQRVRVAFENDLQESSIVHWHGLDVSEENDGHPRFAVEAGCPAPVRVPGRRSPRHLLVSPPPRRPDRVPGGGGNGRPVPGHGRRRQRARVAGARFRPAPRHSGPPHRRQRAARLRPESDAGLPRGPDPRQRPHRRVVRRPRRELSAAPAERLQRAHLQARLERRPPDAGHRHRRRPA